MYQKQKTQANFKPWGDDHPEKLINTARPSYGIKDQLKGLFNPSKMADQLFGVQHSETYPRATRKESIPPQRRETVLFTRHVHEEDVKIQNETKMLLEQLKKQVIILEKSEKTLTKELTRVKVEQMPKKTGIYYLRFLEWLITLVRQLRIKVDEGRIWLSTFAKRQKKKLGYWKMYKKHGTTFGLSHERTLATQTG